MLEKNRMISKIFFIALVVFFITTVSHAQGIFGNSSSSSNSSSNQTSNVDRSPSMETTGVSNTNTTNNTNTTDNSSVMNGDPNIPPPMGEPNQDMHNVDNSQITGQASPRWVRDIDWATCVQKRFNDGESFMASRGACN